MPAIVDQGETTVTMGETMKSGDDALASRDQMGGKENDACDLSWLSRWNMHRAVWKRVHFPPFLRLPWDRREEEEEEKTLRATDLLWVTFQLTQFILSLTGFSFL